MLQSDNSQHRRSIWDGVDQEDFEREIDALRCTRFIPQPQILDQDDWPRAKETDFLDFGVEMQLADDIAFVSAYEYGVEYVTAATVERSRRDVLTIRLAANEGVCDNVKDAWLRLIPLLEQCSAKSLLREECIDHIFNIVTHLNKNKILGRLGSSYFKRPKHHKGDAGDPLWIRFERLLTSIDCTNAEDVALLHDQTAAFREACYCVEKSGAHVDDIKRAVKSAYELTVDGYSLPSRLQNARGLFHVTDGKEVREINKIGNYWRICRSLVRLSRSRSRPFANLRLELVEPFVASTTQCGAIGTKRRHVHAEVQILVQYELSDNSTWPRAIGVSKESCLLCSSFIKAHGHFLFSKSHRQIYSQWTVPDLPDYSPESLNRLQRALLAVRSEVASVAHEAKAGHPRRQQPMQSSTNLNEPNLPTPSVTTIPSAASSGTKTITPGIRSSPVGSVHSWQEVTSQQSPSCIGSRRGSPPGFADYISLDWLEVFVSFAEPAPGELPLENVPGPARISLTAADGAMPAHSLDVSQLRAEEGTVLQHEAAYTDESADLELPITLTNQYRRPILMNCIWSVLA